MKKHNKFKLLLLSIVLGANVFSPSLVSSIYAQDTVKNKDADLEITNIKQSKKNLEIGDRFDITMDVLPLGNIDSWNEIVNESGNIVYTMEKPNITGVDTSKMSYGIGANETISGPGDKVELKIQGLIYTGESQNIDIVVKLGSNLNHNIIVSKNISYELSGKKKEDYIGAFEVKNQENIIVTPNNVQKVEVKVANVSDTDIASADVKLILDENITGVEITQAEAKLTNIKSKETKTISFTIKTTDKVDSGVYKASVNIFGTSYPVRIQVDTSVAPSALEVGLKEGGKYTPGVAQKATIVLNNVGDRDAKNIRVEIVNSENVVISGGGNVKHISKIHGKGKSEAVFNLKIPVSTKIEEVPVQIKLSYLSSTGENKEDTQYVYLNTSKNSGISEVTISNVISPNGTYGVDKNFTVKFNVSSKSGAENVKISVKGDEGIIPKSQNLYFLNSLKPGETKQYAITFAATNLAVTGSHPIEVNVEYGEGEDPVTISQYGSVYINNPEKEDDEEDKIKGKPRVIIGEYVVSPKIVQAGGNFELELGFLNTSSIHTVSNLKANIKVSEQGENEAGNVFTPVEGSNTFYIAKLMPGETVTKKVKMYTVPSAKPKTYEISLEMVYEDEEGNEHTATENVGIPVEQVTRIEAGEIYVEYAQAGMETTLSATLYNRGRTDVSNMMIYLEGEGFTVIEGNENFIGNFEQGASQVYEPIIIADMPGIVKAELVIEYEDTAGNSKEIREPFEFTVEEMIIEDPIIPGGDIIEPFPGQEIPVEGEKTGILTYIIIGAVIVSAIVTLVIIKKRKAKKDEMMFDEED